MRSSVFAIAAVVAASAAAPASAAVVGLAGVSLSTPFVFTPVEGSTFRFSYDPQAAASFNPDTYSVQTTGTAQTSAFGGFLGIPLEPSVFRTDANILVDANLFPSFASFPDLTPIPFSLVAGDLGLRYSVGQDFFYGFARLNGDGTLDIAFSDVANAGINAGAAITAPLPPSVPEPATWAMMIGGFGLVGAAMRRQRTSVRFA
ncbi:hypothetical protein GGR88_001774 [Sphingomonas jejuensis]|uniref:Ice-binding protein C-terminal domain-containing protein n=1 Tax=Sphingomonas jejuensis TaxID=904715 RepID=A0ABX0XM11_9SPHN|nr:PEPxxWA-CTERM sorting domain-containing protein [Sphingomonas jejuensis]NJC34300.1 hypothetical protein [Sphingomonas jejuensis]